jgi:hypothetical protein
VERKDLVPVMAIAIVNGIFSPWVLVVFVLYPVWYPAWAPQTREFVYMASAIILSTLTLMLAGVPAALYERFSSRPRGFVVASIWIVCAALLTLPALPNIMRALGGE